MPESKFEAREPRDDHVTDAPIAKGKKVDEVLK